VRIPLSLESTVAEIMAHPVAGPLVAEALSATGGGLLGGAAGDGDDGDGALGIDREGLAKMMGSMPIGRVAMFPGAPVGVEQVELLIAAANAPQQ
jgi:beta-glucosidase